MTAQSYSIWAALFVPVCCKWANMLSHQPNARPCTASFRPTGHIQWAPRFFQDQYIWRNDEWRTKMLRPIENEWDLRKCVLHSCLKKTSLQEEELKKRPVSVCAAATTHCFIDPLCQCVPLFCQCVSLNTYWAFKKKILYTKGPKGLKLASLPSNNKHSSPPSPPPDTAGWSLSPAGWSRPAGRGPLFSFSDTQPNSKQGSWRRFSPTGTQPVVSHSSSSGHSHPLLRLASTAGEAAASSGIDSPHSTWACCHRLYISLDLIHC